MYNLIPIINRAVIIVKGCDRHQFLQDLITNDMRKLNDQHALYGLLLSPQGRFLHDFIITEYHQHLRLEVEAARKDDLQRLLTAYKLRSKVTIADESDQYQIYAWLGHIDALPKDVRAHAYLDPRLTALGHRLILPKDHTMTCLDDFDMYDSHRLHLGVPDGSRDMTIDKAIPLEFGMDHLQAISWQKGCYLGQELTARTKHRGIVRKGIFPAQFTGPPPAYGTNITLDHYKIGQTLSHCQNMVLCRLRTDHSTDLFDGKQILQYPEGTLQAVRPLWLNHQ